MEKQKKDLDIRLIELAALIIELTERLPKTIAGNHLTSQLIRSGTAPALQYGEAQGAESRNDFIHKMKIALKELRESFNCLRIIKRLKWHSIENLDSILDETNQLISIFVKSIHTAQMNKNQQKDNKKKD
ncbi:MAG: four helix bundle protein [Flavisolibacter sp.]|jgi:four helix bundle protein